MSKCIISVAVHRFHNSSTRFAISDEAHLRYAQTPSPSPSANTCLHDQAFDFEISGQDSCFQLIPQSSGTVSLSTDVKTVKHGTKSLKWIATAASKLQLKSATFAIPNSWLQQGGVKVWIYKESASPGKTLEVEYKHSSTIVGRFTANLNFTGWRGIWVKFEECKLASGSLASPAVIDEVNFALSDTDTIYIDLLEFQRSLGKQSRDLVVPPISPFGLTLYDKSNFWQQTYKWSQKTIPASPSIIDQQKKKSLEHIKSRLKNWYLSETKTSSNFPSGSFLEKRWVSLLKGVKNAHRDYDGELTFDGGKVVRPPLFCRNCKYEEKFGFIMEKLLLPLALEYHLRSRANEVTDAATNQLPELNSGVASRKRNAIIAIAGRDGNMQTTFESYITSSSPLTTNDVETAINTLNLHRLSKINNLLDFVKQQGFSNGSGLGSLDHEMNKDGAGFVHTLFLISDSLSLPANKSRLLDLISTAKWYNDFGEIYQSPTFEFKGTTSDRMVSLMLFRLIIVLVMPSDHDDEIKAKIRDMEALGRWMNNALTVNEGLGGVIKPDFTAYHHKTFYGSAYAPQALHNAALVQYLLGGTAFPLSTSSTNNIRRGLETLRLIAVKYSTPNSVNGRYPDYFNKALIKTVLPSYAYISVSHPSSLPSTIPTGISVNNLNEPQMFLRLFNDSSVNEYLEDGKPNKGKYYYNSLGSLQIMEVVNSTAASQSISAEPSPEGHWSKNFAALSVHRRKDWAVTVKGFNNFVWDYETSATENVYGLFASHGALLVANSETLLEVHDVEHGWDWAKVPGATTIAMGSSNIDDLNLGSGGRFYNNKKLAGSLTFEGTMSIKNGLFGINFLQPEYGLASSDWRQNIDFRFKKSVFFFENLLACLGSNIRARRTAGRVAQTTLFQDKLISGVVSSYIEVDGVQKNALSNYNHATASPSSLNYVTLTDAKRNVYYVPSPSKSALSITVQSQTSKSDDGKSPTSGIYGTAWLEHSTSHPSYEYAVLIPTTSYHTPLADVATAQATAGSEVYKVLQKDATAHVVQFLKSPKSWSALSHPITGYVIFGGTSSLPANGPVEAVSSGDCLIMAEETTEFIYISISSPDLNFNRTSTTPLESSSDVGQELLYNSTSTKRSIRVTLRNQVSQCSVQEVHGTPDNYTPIVEIENNGKDIRFRNLKNGFSVEVKLTRFSSVLNILFGG